MKQSIRAIAHPIQARITLPGSKSITNRALLIAALADGVSELFDILISDDTRAFINALHELGTAIILDEDSKSCIVAGTSGVFPKKSAAVWCHDAGTAARFLLAACAATAGAYQFDASEQLRARPIQPLLKILISQGADILPDNAATFPLTVLGSDGLAGGEVSIESSQTGQFVSALLMVAPFSRTPMLIETERLVSTPYVAMTCTMMHEFGVLVKRMHQGRYFIPVPQRYLARNYIVEPDLSTASYFFAAAAVTGGEITIQPLNREKSKQADIQFLNVLEKMGCAVIEDEAGLTVRGTQELHGVNVDMRDFSDTFMTLAAVAPFAKTPTTITNIAHARLKESDRIIAMQTGLEKLKIKVESGRDWIRIHPSLPQAGEIDSYSDHRIAMAFSVIGLRVSGVVIDGAECVSKTCPDFFKMWEGLK